LCFTVRHRQNLWVWWTKEYSLLLFLQVNHIINLFKNSNS
jgi:hypothetical protein